MERDKLMKIVYEDGHIKIIRGYILKEDEHSILVKKDDGVSILIGKRTLVKAIPVGDVNE